MYWETRGAMAKARLKAEGAQEILQILQESLLPGQEGSLQIPMKLASFS